METDSCICMKCCETVDFIYNFNKTCLKNINILSSYKEILKGNMSKKQCGLYINLTKRKQSKGNDISLIDVKIEPLDSPLNNMMCETDFVLENYKNGVVEIKEEAEDYEIYKQKFKTSLLNSEMEIDKIVLNEERLNEIKKRIENESLKPHTQDLENISVQSFEEIFVKEEECIELIEGENLFEDVVEKSHCSLEYGESGSQNQLSFQENPIHANKKKFRCKECGKILSCSPNLYRHMRIHSGIRPFKCGVCEKSFFQKNHMERHMTVHTGERTHKCDICKKLFSHKSSLNRHILIHTGEKPYKCDICEKLFSHQDYLKQHMITHTGERNHKCDICNKTFKQKIHLVQHKLCHSVVKRHFCDQCDLQFVNKSDLIKHKQVHSGEKPFLVQPELMAACSIAT